jgi:chromosome segregation ATPase
MKRAWRPALCVNPARLLRKERIMAKKAGATLDDVVHVLGNLLRVVTGHGERLDKIGERLDGISVELQHHSELLQHHSELLQHHSELLQHHSELLQHHSETLQHHGEMLQRQGEELRVHSGLFEHVIQEQRISNARLDLVVERLDHLTQATLRGRSMDTERFATHESRIERLEAAVFGPAPATAP